MQHLKNSFGFLSIILLLSQCYGVNKKTSEIGTLNYVCSDNVQIEILNKYTTDKITNSILKSKVGEFKTMPFETNILYFESGPTEIIAISKDWYSVRYVYNPDISMRIQNGLGNSMNEQHKNRIMGRIYAVFRMCGCIPNS